MPLKDEIMDLYLKAHKTQGLEALDIMSQAFELIPKLVKELEDEQIISDGSAIRRAIDRDPPGVSDGQVRSDSGDSEVDGYRPRVLETQRDPSYLLRQISRHQKK